MEEIRILVIWLRARLVEHKHDERGFTAVEWLLIALGVITIAGITSRRSLTLCVTSLGCVILFTT